MQIVLYLIIVLGCGYIGFGIGSYYKIRERFFADFYSFSDYVEHNIDFFQVSVNNIINNYINLCQSNKEFKIFLQKYLENDNTKKSKSLSFLKKNEEILIENFMTQMGATDSENQIKGIEHFKQQILSIWNDSKAELKKNGSIAVKLGVFLGLTIVICLI